MHILRKVKDIIVTVAQTIPKKQNVKRNINDHIKFASLAAEYKTDLVLFPEMSLTGYERELAEEQAFTQNDHRLIELQNLSVKENIVIVAGAPVKIDSRLFIASIMKTTSLQKKQTILMESI